MNYSKSIYFDFYIILYLDNILKIIKSGIHYVRKAMHNSMINHV